MKHSTYLMLGAIVAGLITIPVSVGLFMSAHVVNESHYRLGGEPRCLPLGKVDKVIYDDSNSWRIANFKGISVTESDTARTATLVTSVDWLPYLDCRVDSGAVTVKVDYDAMVRKYYDDGKRPGRVRLRSEDFVVARVIMPHGWLREVAARKKTLYLDSVKTPELLSKVDDRLVLNDCRIGKLNSRSKRINELKLDNSTIGDAVFWAVFRKFTVNCTSDSSVIDRLYIDSVYHNDKHLNLKFHNANIRDFKYNPKDKETIVNLELDR